MTINGDLLGQFITYQSTVITALLPLLTAVIGIFLTFAIANSLRFFIQKVVK